MTTYYNLPESAHDAKVIELANFPGRAVISYYNHMENLHFAPRNYDLGIDGSSAINTDDESFATEYSYPLEMARSIVEQVNR